MTSNPPPLYGGHRDPKRQLAEILRGTTKRKYEPPPRRQGPSAKLSEPLHLTFPLPPKEVNPNQAHNAHWTRTSKAKRRYRADVALGLIVQKVPVLLLREVTAQPTFYFRQTRRRDKDNAAASLKSCWDAMTEHGLLADDVGLTPLAPVLAKDKDNPRLELTIWQEA